LPGPNLFANVNVVTIGYVVRPVASAILRVVHQTVGTVDN